MLPSATTLLESTRLEDDVLAAALAAVEARWPDARPLAVTAAERHTNPRLEVRYRDGRTLVVKRGEAEWVRQRFAASGAACGLLRRRTGVIAPEPVPLPATDLQPPLEVYWKVELTTLADAWPVLDSSGRTRALRDWGRLLRRIHRVRPRGHGALPRAERTAGSLQGHLATDLGDRLLPAVRQTWPEGVDVLEALVDAVPAIAARAGEPVLLHGDPHQANILCELEGRKIRCTGVIDLEAAWGGPPEADVAVAELIHGPLFRPLPDGWTAEFRRGYGEVLDGAALAFYRAMHLANLGYHAALTGLHAHAADVLDEARGAVAEFRRLLR
jgi:aminoglycoside phosphotransferase (APT) family kinase protein